MRIKWGNFIFLLLVIFATTVWLRYQENIRALLSCVFPTATRYTPEEQTTGLIAFTLILIAVLTLAKIMSDRKNND